MYTILLTLLLNAAPANNCVEKIECTGRPARYNRPGEVAVYLVMTTFKYADGTGFVTCSMNSMQNQFAGFNVHRIVEEDWTCEVPRPAAVMTFVRGVSSATFSYTNQADGSVQRNKLDCKKVY